MICDLPAITSDDMDLTELQPPVDFSAIFANAELLRPWLAEQSGDIENARQLSEDVVERLKAGGLFRMTMPRLWGGPELTSMEQVLVIETLSRGDVSSGWCAMIGSDSGLYSGYLDDAVARNLYPHLDVIQAGWVYPAGRADEIDGGYVVSGQWQFLSGSSHADMIAAGCTVYRNGEPVIGPAGLPEWRLVLAPRSHWRVQDTWRTTGLRGTASHDYTTFDESLIIPREHSFSFLEPVREGLLWRLPETLLRKMSGVPLGLARRAIDDTVQLLESKTDRSGLRRYSNLGRVQSAVAESKMLLGGARAYVLEALEAQWRALEAGRSLTKSERSDVWLSRMNAFQSARSITRLLFDTVGADAVYTERSSLDRALRDAETMCQHIVGQRRELETVGAFLLNAETGPTSPML